MSKLSNGMKLLLITIVSLVIILASNIFLKGVKLDLTEDKRYTLAPETIGLLQRLEEPVELKLYYSRTASQSIPELQSFASNVQDFLREFVSHSDKKLTLEILDPEPFSDLEQEAKGYGLIGSPIGARETNVFHGLVGINTLDERKEIPFILPEDSAQLEYKLVQMVQALSFPKKPAIGVMSRLPILGQQTNRGEVPAWAVFLYMQDVFEIGDVGMDVDEIPAEVDVLLVVHPRDITETAKYAIDQFIMRGGRAIFMVDPMSQFDRGDQIAGMGVRSSDLNSLFNAWGFEVPVDQMVVDADYALRHEEPGQPAIPVLPFLQLPPEAANDADPASKGLQGVNMHTASYIKQLKGATTTITPLLSSSTNTNLFAANQVALLGLGNNPGQLLEFFKQEKTGTSYPLVARIQGNVKSAFAKKPKGTPANLKHIATSQKPMNIIVMADSDMLYDGMWLQQGQLIATNGLLAQNAAGSFIDTVDTEATQIRASFQRPFTVVREIQKDAEQRFNKKKTELENRLAAAQAELKTLRERSFEQGNLQQTEVQQRAINKYLLEKQSIERELRQVQHSLKEDIEVLGSRVKLINILAIPLLIAFIALITTLRRSQGGRGGSVAVLATLAVVGIAVAVWVFIERDDAKGKGQQLLFPSLQQQLADVDQIEIYHPDDKASEAETAPPVQAVKFNKQGDQWTLKQIGGYRVDFEPLHNMLQSIAQAEVLGKKTDNPDYFDRLQLQAVNNPMAESRLIKIYSKGKVLLSLVVGKHTTLGDSFITYVREENSKQTYAVSGQIFLDVNLKEWTPKDLIHLPRERFTSATIKHQNGDVLTAKRIVSVSTNLQVLNVPEGRELIYPEVGNSLVNGFALMQITGVQKAEGVDTSAWLSADSEFVLDNGIVLNATVYKQDQPIRYFLTFAATAPADASAEAKAEAEKINQKAKGWLFGIPHGKFTAFVTHMNDVLKKVEKSAAPKPEPEPKPESEPIIAPVEESSESEPFEPPIEGVSQPEG